MTAAAGPVLKSVRAQFRLMGIRRGHAPALYELALRLAVQVDFTASTRDLPSLTRELRNTLEELAKVAPAKIEEADALDELAARRAGGAAAPAGAERPAL